MTDDAPDLPPLRILIADDHAFFRRGLREVLEEQPDMLVVAEASDGEEAVSRARELYPQGLDVVLMDLQMPRLDGVAATKRILSDVQGLPVIVLAASSDDSDLLESVSAGAVGFLTKSLSPAAIVRGLRDFHRNRSLPMSRTMAFKIVAHLGQLGTASEAAPTESQGRTPRAEDLLTPREREVIELVATGATDREIASHLIIAERTVKVHLQSIFRKLKARNRTDAVIRYRNGTT